MDLAPGKSLIEWAVQHGHTCFAISYRNPDTSMRDLGFEDYLKQGPLDAVRIVKEITGSPKVNTLSVCLGGTLTAIGLAHNASIGDDSIKSATFLNTHTDFSTKGTLGVFTDEATIAGLEKQMAKRGYLDSEKMAHTFDALRANDLVFSYVVNNWLLGKKPPAFDLLVWNKDSTRMPAKMHSQYLRSCYLRNEFASGEFEVDGHKVAPGKVDIDTYVLSAVDDHIVPWVSGYKTTQLLGGRNRYVLSNSGHIAGIVNPPNPKSKHWVSDGDLPADPHEWKDGAKLQTSTWWEDWSTWIADQGGPMKAAPRKPAARNTLRSRPHQAATSATARDLRPYRALTPTILTSPATAGAHSTDQKDPHDCARDAFRRTSVRHHRSRRRPGTFPCTRAGASRRAGRGQRRRWRTRRQRRVDLSRATRGRRDHRVRRPGRAEPRQCGYPRRR